MDLSFWTSFGAGFITFFTPCVMPLIPVYISMVTGLSIEDLKSGAAKNNIWQVSLKILLFIAGFTVIFVALGATGAAVGQFLLRYRFYLLKGAGLLMLVFGLYLLGLIRLPFLDNVARINASSQKKGGLLSAFFLGVVFGFAWSPCSGPILGAIIMLASTSANVGKGAAYLFAYSLGIGVPLFLSGILFTYFLSFMTRFRKFFSVVDKVAGVLLSLMGILIILGYQHILYL